MIENLTLKLAHELVEKAIALKGEDFIYRTSDNSGVCSYVNVIEDYSEDDDPTYGLGCIVGHALLPALPEIDLEEFVARGYLNEERAGALLDWLHNSGYVSSEIPQDVYSYLEALQLSQDNDRPWGEANEQAKRGFVWSFTTKQYLPQGY